MSKYPLCVKVSYLPFYIVRNDKCLNSPSLGRKYSALHKPPSPKLNEHGKLFMNFILD